MTLNYVPLDDNETYFYTSNLWFCSAMATKDVHAVTFDKPASEATLIYERDSFIEDCWDFFRKKQLKVDALSLSESYKNIQKWINS